MQHESVLSPNTTATSVNSRKPGAPTVADAAPPAGIAIVDEDEQSCIALRSLVESTPGFRCLGVYRTLESARAGILASNPSIVLINLLLPDGCGIEFTRFLKCTFPRIVVVVATGFDLEDVMASSLAAGASGYLAKPIHPGQFLATLRFALGQHTAPPSERASAPGSSRSIAAGKTQLSSREQAVMALLSDGLLYKEIAARLGVSVSVVHKLLHRTYGKLNASNRTEAIKHWQTFNERGAGAFEHNWNHAAKAVPEPL